MENDNNIKSGKSSFFGDVLKLVTGTTFAQMLVILASPIIARLFTPEDLGLQAPFISIGSILGVIVCLRYELAIMLPESDDEAANILVLSLVVAVLISLVSVPVFWIAGPLITQWLHAPELNPYLRLIPPVLIFGGIGMGHPALNYWASRTRRYKELSITRVIGQFVTVGYQLSTGILGFATAGNLILSNVFGAVISPCVLAWQIWNEDKKLFLRSLNWRVMFEELKKHKKFPIYSTWSSLLNSASWQLPSLLLSAFFSSTIVGYYSLGFRILQVPMSLIGSAIGQVFFQRAAESSVKGTLAHLVEEVFSRLVVLGLFPMFMLTIIGKDLFTFLFGTNWAEAGVYAQILSVWAFFWFVSAPMNTLFSILGKQEFGLKWNIVVFLTRILSLIIGGYFVNPRLAIILFSISGIFVYGYLDIAIMKKSGVPLSRSLGILAKGLMYFAPFGVIIVLLKLFGIHLLLLLIAVAISFMLYGFLLLKLQPNLFHIHNQ